MGCKALIRSISVVIVDMFSGLVNILEQLPSASAVDKR